MSPTFSPRVLALLTVVCVAVIFLDSCSFLTSPGTSKDAANVSQDTARPDSAKVTLPPQQGFVNDFADVFDPEAERQLESLLMELKSKSEIEFAVVTVNTTGNESIFDYSLALARQWGVGPKDTSRGGGLLLMLSINEREWRLQVSRSLEKDLPDEVCKELGDQSLDLYRQGKYSEGIRKYVDAIIARLEVKRAFQLDR